jgi:hypothetical protein
MLDEASQQGPSKEPIQEFKPKNDPQEVTPDDYSRPAHATENYYNEPELPEKSVNVSNIRKKKKHIASGIMSNWTPNIPIAPNEEERIDEANDSREKLATFRDIELSNEKAGSAGYNEYIAKRKELEEQAKKVKKGMPIIEQEPQPEEDDLLAQFKIPKESKRKDIKVKEKSEFIDAEKDKEIEKNKAREERRIAKEKMVAKQKLLLKEKEMENLKKEEEARLKNPLF